jgi:hypothetical protein
MNKIHFAVLVVAFLFCAGVVLGQDDSTGAMTRTSNLTAEIAFGTGIADRMPVGQADTFSVSVDTVYFWTKIMGATAPTTVNHLWFHDGQKMASVSLPVRTDSWRTWSYKTILPEWTGEWKVVVTDDQGKEIASKTFYIRQ